MGTRGKFSGGSFPGCNLLGLLFPRDNFPGDKFPGVHFQGDIFSGGIFPGGIFPRTAMTYGFFVDHILLMFILSSKFLLFLSMTMMENNNEVLVEK